MCWVVEKEEIYNVAKFSLVMSRPPPPPPPPPSTVDRNSEKFMTQNLFICTAISINVGQIFCSPPPPTPNFPSIPHAYMESDYVVTHKDIRPT
jgi:hypothetical protein